MPRPEINPNSSIAGRRRGCGCNCDEDRGGLGVDAQKHKLSTLEAPARSPSQEYPKTTTYLEAPLYMITLYEVRKQFVFLGQGEP